MRPTSASPTGETRRDARQTDHRSDSRDVSLVLPVRRARQVSAHAHRSALPDLRATPANRSLQTAALLRSRRLPRRLPPHTLQRLSESHDLP